MEDTLAKIRPHTSSPLLHQKAPATLLVAIESTFKDQNIEPTPTAYFAALLTTLDGTLQRNDKNLGEGDMLPAALYLLALVAPFVPKPVIRSHLNTLLSLTAPLFPHLIAHAPSLRSQLSLYHVIYQSLDRSQLETAGIRQTFASVLNLCLDQRPKVRRKAAEVAKDTLCNPPNPLVRHPYAERVAEWVKTVLTEAGANPLSKGKAKNSAGPESAIHVLAFLRPVLPYLPPSACPTITALLLNLPRLGNPYLSQSVYTMLSELFALSEEDDASNLDSQLPEILSIVLSSPPPKTDATISPSWVQVLGGAMQALKAVDGNACTNELSKVWKAVWNFLDSNDNATRQASAQSLGTLIQCFSPALISIAIADPQGKSTIPRIISQVAKALDNITYARSTPELLTIVSSLMIGLNIREDRTTATAAERLLLPVIAQVADLRVRKGFEYKEAADATLSTAVHILGPEVLFRLLPLNLEPEQRKLGHEPRAYLLPLLNQTHPSPLKHFVSYFVPLSEKMFDLQQTAEMEGRQSEAKVWSVLVGQVWNGLWGYCYVPLDLNEALDSTFSQLLSQLLYSQVELRPAILKALKVLIESNQLLASAEASDELLVNNASPQEAVQNLAFLRTQAESWLAVLFNIFGSVSPDSKGMVGDVISIWASIAGEEVVTNAYKKVIELFKANLVNAQHAPNTANSTSEAGNATAMTQDILILLLPYLSAADAEKLFEFCLTPEVLSGRDNGIQKRGYKILAKLVEGGKVVADAEATLKRLDDLLQGLAPAAKKDRFNLLSSLTLQLPPSSLHVIPTIIPEAVLGTKETAEKARNAAFELVVVMGRKMSAGGVVKRNLLDGMDEDADEQADANIEEFMTMMAGGLAGASPHMISATVTAVSRLVFEFKDKISPNMHNEIISTLLVFLTSANREIVKSVLGFVKLAIHILAVDLLRPHLTVLVPALLRWSHDHHNHFKVKVRHIFERILRRFSWDEVYNCAGNDEATKVLLNIKKRKERARRKKVAREEEEDAESGTAANQKPATGDAFEDVLYGSESELEDSDEEVFGNRGAAKSARKKAEHGARLKLDDDEPMDLLQGAAAHVTNSKSARKRKPGEDAAHFKIEENTGKMIIEEESDSDSKKNQDEDDVIGNAYKESLTSVDGFTRGPGGRIKFNKDTKKRRREAEELDDDIDMADGEKANPGSKKTRKKARDELRLGQEFKAKRAGGDVKKNGMDPYAYLSLSEAAKRGKGNKRIGIASKR